MPSPESPQKRMTALLSTSRLALFEAGGGAVAVDILVPFLLCDAGVYGKRTMRPIQSAADRHPGTTMSPDANPFAALSLIVAPAIMTNACTVLAMSTSNRLARTADRARELSREIEGPEVVADDVAARRSRDLGVAEARSLLLLRALRSVYVALTGFSIATLASLLGATFVASGQSFVTMTLESAAILAGALAVASLVYASVLLVRETRLAVASLQERAAAAQLRARRHGQA